jgi:hypothetical protein
MNKTRIVVLNLAIAGLLEIEVAEAQERTPGLVDEPAARASPDGKRRLRLGVEQDFARYQHAVYDDVLESSGLSWGFGGTALGADYRIIAGFEAGLAAGVSGTRSTFESPQGGQADSSSTWLSLNPRVGYALPLAPTLELVPRVGLEYSYGVSKDTSFQLDGSNTEQAHATQYLAVMSGVLLEYQPAQWFFVAPQIGFGYQVHTSIEGVGSTWFSAQPYETWGLDLKLGAGARI